MKTSVRSRKLIKPSTPTPPNLRSYKISAMDEINPTMHVIRILYYQSFDEKMTKNFEESLARVLTLFYPLAGRYVKDKHFVDCNDEGAVCLEARVDCELHQILNPPVNSELSWLNNLLPVGVGEADDPTDPMLAVQLNKFQGGGLAIGVCASHRIFDSYSMSMFLAAWSNHATGGDSVVKPDFNSASIFPAEDAAPLYFGVSRVPDHSIVIKRFVFDKDAISRLRDRANPGWKLNTSTERPPSRVAVVSALITQALLRADTAKLGGRTRDAYVGQAINIRERTVPPISKYTSGTWVSMSGFEYTANECCRLEYREIVSKMRETLIQGVKDCEKILSDKTFGRWALIDVDYDAAKKAACSDSKVVWFTDWSKFGEYEFDFGWGKPIWVSLSNVLLDMVILMNTKENDGIEAWVYLRESDMAYFEQDEDVMKLITN
ncbi:pelargonidin 3-O-(6-caffeoylglucoside) 5-O-(6-O-malonylglucoside) 4'''-malonyltransferase-like [Primulina huaijiensis]|uniref:pelargonidin 3-O-(6-caffeoylglucoside) 5-O-(6-O-malonylglucoside) 4'''-malonyltransferase-like n=1 Tax=Primulina huaijiensis TaxID=1492673 RepID=UPI003CC740CA